MALGLRSLLQLAITLNTADQVHIIGNKIGKHYRVLHLFLHVCIVPKGAHDEVIHIWLN